MNEPELLALINQAKEEGWTELDLSGLYLETLPQELGTLTQLEVLKLGRKEDPWRSNYLTELPDWLAQLTNLHTLDLSENNLAGLPDWMAQLTNLHTLNLFNNNLTELPDWMAQLTNLHTLDLFNNNLAGLPDWIAQLKNLHALDLSYTNLTELPDGIAQLTNLQSLDLTGLQLTEVPDWMAQLKNLQSLGLRENDLVELPGWVAQFSNIHTLDLSLNSLIELPSWIANLKNLHTLELAYAGFSELPKSMAQLTNLHTLNLQGLQLTELPDWIASLKNLQSLILYENKLTELPDWIANLKNLQSLNLSNNNLTELPDWIASLKNLQSLSLDGNNLTELPDWIANLKNLQSLSLGRNNLTELPDWIANLKNLQSLILYENKLTELPDWIANSQSLPRLRALYIGKNPLTVPPAEVLEDSLEQEYTQANIDNIRAYFRQLAQGEEVYFYEAKLLIIGEGGAGKTSLARKLLDPVCDLSVDEGSTDGIDILPWYFDLPSDISPDNDNAHYTANIWDFGGQEIYFATHQFFLTKRSVYLLVADTRKQHTDFYDWLRMQETFGESSAVILVKNRNRQHGNSFTIENLPQLQERFPNLKEITEVDLDEAPDGSEWRDLLHHVQDELLKLPHIGQPRPGTWVAVRKAIDVDERDIIRWSEFVALCRDQGMDREDDIRQLGEYLHNLGDVLYFHDDPVLCDYVILKPTWGLDAVYAVLDNQEVTSKLGEFARSDLRAVWSDPVYGGYHEHLLRLMQNFQLCYELHEQRDTYIAPQLLVEKGPDEIPDFHETLEMRYAYPAFMPRGILSRAIVKLHHRIADQNLVWRSGAILSNGSAQAEILELRGEKQIRIRVSGTNKQDLLTEIRIALDELHKGFPKLRVERQIPCNCETCMDANEPHFYALAKLQERLKHGRTTIECDMPPTFSQVTIQTLLSEFPVNRHDRSGILYSAENLYLGDHNEGDRYKLGNIENSTGLAVGKDTSSSVTQGGKTID